MINWEARVRALENTARFGRPAEWSAKQDPGQVPGHVMPALCSLAAQLGHPVVLDDGIPWYALGLTASDGHHGITVIRPGMSPASTARTTGHEIGHSLATTVRDHHRASLLQALGEEDIAEELGCELGTGAFCAAHGIGTGAFCGHYVGSRLQGMHAPEASIHQAARLAAALHEAVTDAR